MRARIGPFEFDRSSGELFRADASGRWAPVTRLAPQPAALLALLLDHRGDLVSRKEIQERLWPEVQVDYEQSLHFCVRQVRAALGDSASDPQFVETVPRRGYRLRRTEAPQTCSRPAEDRSKPEAPPPTSETKEAASIYRRRTLRLAWIFIAGLALVATLFGLARGVQTPPLRVAVVPFDPEAESNLTRIGEWVLAEISNRLGQEATVLGPRTTGAPLARGASLPELAASLKIDYIVNARKIGRGNQTAVLFELIRSSDGKHVWVIYDENITHWRSRARVVANGILDYLGAL